MTNGRPDFETLANTLRTFAPSDRPLVGHVPTIALTPVADGRTGAYEENIEKTWRMVEKVYDLLASDVTIDTDAATEATFGPSMGIIGLDRHDDLGMSAHKLLDLSWACSAEERNHKACLGRDGFAAPPG